MTIGPERGQPVNHAGNRAPVVPAATLEVPRPACAKCEDWRTVVVLNTEFPCPVCRPDEFAAWHTANGRAPGTAQATA